MISRKEIAVAVLMILLLAGAWALVSGLDRANAGGQTQYVYDAVHNAALTCYAVEGAYPTDLEYLREHYGLAYDEDRYFVLYNAYGSNLMPEINIIEVEADE